MGLYVDDKYIYDIENMCCSCTFLENVMKGNTYRCEKHWEYVHGSQMKCDGFTRAYSRSDDEVRKIYAKSK